MQNTERQSPSERKEPIYSPDGQPIVLLNDRQTIGGYPRLGALTPLSLARLEQKLPGTVVRMRAVVQEMAHREQVGCLNRLGLPL